MENVLSKFEAVGLTLELSNEKLTCKTLTSSETYLIKKINGIGLFDLVDDFEKQKDEKRDNQWYRQFFKWVGIFLILLGLYFLFNVQIGGIGGFVELSIAGGISYFISTKLKPDQPKILSALKILTSSGEKDYVFNKEDIKSGDINDFISKVESTLTN